MKQRLPSIPVDEEVDFTVFIEPNPRGHECELLGLSHREARRWVLTEGRLRRERRWDLSAFDRVVITLCFSLTLLSHSSIVYLEIDNRQCIQSSSQCFQSATDVAAFLGALASLGNLNIPYKIEAVKSKCGCSAGEESQPKLPSLPRVS